MGQILGPDKIATPSHLAGTITLPPSLLTLGGRQYRTSALSRLISADVSLTSNTLYFVYAQIIGGAPVLRISLSAPSTYRVANPTANLVSAFYSNGVGPAFGAFVNVEGKPVCDEVSQGAIAIFGSGSNPVKPAANPDYACFQRDGSYMHYRYSYQQSAIGTSGTGNYEWPLPANIVADHQRIAGGAAYNSNSSQIGMGRFGNATIAYIIQMHYQNSNNRLSAVAWQTGGALTLAFNSSAQVTWASVAYGSWNVTLPIVGWTNTPLKDL